MRNLFAILFFFGIFLSMPGKAIAQQDSCGVIAWQDTSALPDMILVATAFGTPPFTYSWSNGETTSEIQVFDSLNYFCVTITDATGCTSESCVLPVNDVPVYCWTSISLDSLNGDALIANGGGGTAPYQYFWSNGNTSQVIYPTTSGYYCVYSIDANGCTSYETCFYYQGNIPDSCWTYISAQIDSTGGANLLAVGGGVAPYLYLWSTGESTPAIDVLQDGIYCVSVIDAVGCVASSCYDYSDSSGIDPCFAYIVALPAGNGGESLCAYSGGPGPYTYDWSTGESTFIITVLQEGDYCVTVTDANGCEAGICYYYSDSSTVDSCYVYLDIQANPTGGANLLAVAGGIAPYTYLWSTGESTSAINVLHDGTYCVTVIDAVGCESGTCYTYDGTIPVDSCYAYIVALPGSNGSEILCAYSSGPGPYTYNWSTGESTFIINVFQEDDYCVTVTDANGCEASTCYYFSGSNPSDSCMVYIGGDSLGLTNGVIWAIPFGQSPFAYLWSTGETTVSIQVTVEGEYCVTVVDATGCQAAFCTYAYPAQPDSCGVSIYLSPAIPPTGDILETNVFGVGPYTYLWSTGETTPFIQVITTDTFCVTVTDSYGCVATDCYYYGGNNGGCSVVIYEDTTGVLIADTPANGPVPFTYLWSTGETSQQIVVTAPGTYCVTFTDGSGCEAYACYTYLGGGSNNVCGVVFLQDSFEMIGSTTVSLYLLENGGTTFIDEQHFQGEEYYWYYDFVGLADGDYIVKAAIDAGAPGADDYVPTYHLSALMWDEADVIPVPNTDPFCRGAIVMQPDGNFTGGGSGSLAGNVYDLYGALAGVTILIYDEFGNLLGYIYTDANGEFSFLNLPYGTYQIVIEYTGFNHASYWVTLTEDTPRITDLSFEVLDGEISTGTFETAPAASLQAYPNPVIDHLMIQMDDSWANEVTINMYNLEGKLIRVWTEKTSGRVIDLEVGNLISGMYFYQINDGKQVASGKMIKD